MVFKLIKAISVRTFLKLKKMPTKHSECPITNPQNCKEYYNPQICAFSRKDGTCLKKKKIRQRPKEKSEEVMESSNNGQA